MKITVLMGGASAERDVSLASGLRIVEALRSTGHEVTALDPARGVIDAAAERAMRSAPVVTKAPPTPEALLEIARAARGAISPALGTLPEIRGADVVFVALHGGQGEDGTLQAVLDMVGVPYTGSGHLCSALAMDKDLSKALFRAAGVPTADWIMAPATVAQVAATLGFPCIVKPSKQGSTVGLSLVKRPEELEPAVAEAFRHDDEVMIERFVPGRELTVGVLGDVALPVGEITPKNELYDYEAKYIAGMAVEEFPAALTPEQTLDVQAHALAAFRALKLRGYARIDFRLTPEGEFACLEANTAPGMTGTSLLPQAAQAHGLSFAELCERIVAEALNGRDSALFLLENSVPLRRMVRYGGRSPPELRAVRSCLTNRLIPKAVHRRRRMSYPYSEEQDSARLTPAVKWLIVINVAIYFVQVTVLGDAAMQSWLGFDVANLTERPWTVLTYMFVHAGFWHLAVNMYVLWLFGTRLEAAWTPGSFVRYFLLCGLGGWLAHLVFARGAGLVGASAGIYGVMLAYAMRWPDDEMLLFFVVPLKVKHAVAAMVAIDLAFGIVGGGGTAYFAHLGGFAAGYLYLKWIASNASLEGLRQRMSPIPDVPDEPPRAVPRSHPRPRERAPEVDDVVARSNAVTAKRVAAPTLVKAPKSKADQLNDVLDKISEQGLASLTSDERRLLEEMSRTLRGG